MNNYKKLTPNDVQSIGQRYTRHNQTQKHLAKEFFVSERTIGRVLRDLGLSKPEKKELHGIDIVNYLVNLTDDSMFHALIGASIEQRYAKKYNISVQAAMFRLSQELNKPNGKSK